MSKVLAAVLMTACGFNGAASPDAAPVSPADAAIDAPADAQPSRVLVLDNFERHGVTSSADVTLAPGECITSAYALAYCGAAVPLTACMVISAPNGSAEPPLPACTDQVSCGALSVLRLDVSPIGFVAMTDWRIDLRVLAGANVKAWGAEYAEVTIAPRCPVP